MAESTAARIQFDEVLFKVFLEETTQDLSKLRDQRLVSKGNRSMVLEHLIRMRSAWHHPQPSATISSIPKASEEEAREIVDNFLQRTHSDVDGALQRTDTDAEGGTLRRSYSDIETALLHRTDSDGEQSRQSAAVPELRASESEPEVSTSAAPSQDPTRDTDRADGDVANRGTNAGNGRPQRRRRQGSLVHALAAAITERTAALDTPHRAEVRRLQQDRAVSQLESSFRNRLESILQTQQHVRSMVSGGGAALPVSVYSQMVHNANQPQTETTGELRDLIQRHVVQARLTSSEFRDRLERVLLNRHTPGRQRSRHNHATDQLSFAQPPAALISAPQQYAALGLGAVQMQQMADLRSEMSRMQAQLDEMRRLVSAGFEVSLDIQRSVRQELAGFVHTHNIPIHHVTAVATAAVSPASAPPSSSTPNGNGCGMCVVCSERSSDALLYRCGHVGTCFTCATALHNSNRGCPICRAPILDVCRIYIP